MKKIKLTKTKNFFKKIPRILAKKTFLVFLILLIFALILGGIVFYFYVISVEPFDNIEIGEEKSFLIDRAAYQKIFNQWQIRDKIFSETDSREYTNIFR